MIKIAPGSGKKRTAQTNRPQASAATGGVSFERLLNLRGALAWCAALVVVFATIAAWRREVIWSPPYWDSAMGLFLEADFLARHGFDYQLLISQERRFIEGGSAIYIISILPTLLALAMRLLPSVAAVLAVGHLFSFAIAALLALLIFSALRPRMAEYQAALVCIALITTPLLATQIDMIGMDLPMTVAAISALWLLLRGRYIAASLASLLAFFMKISGGIATGAVILYLAGLLCFDRDDRGNLSRQWRWIGLGAALICLAIEITAVDWSIGLPKSAVEQYEADVEQGVSSLAEARYWCPDLVLLFFVSIAAYLSAAAWRLWRALALRGDGGTIHRVANTLRDWLFENRHALAAWAIIIGTLLVLSRIYTIPRYLTLPLVFLWFNLGILLFSTLRLRRLGAALVIGIIAFNLLNADGRFYPRPDIVDRFDGRTGALLERSREYLADHRANIAAVDAIRRASAGKKIIATNPFVHFLSLPSLGYVDEPLNGYAANTFNTESFRPISLLRNEPPQALIYIWVENRFAPLAQCSLPKPAPGDIVLYPRVGPTDSLAVFEKSWPPDLSAAQRKAVYTSQLWPGDNLLEHAEHLARQGEILQAIQVYVEIVRREPLRLGARQRLAELLTLNRDYGAALAQYQFLLDQSSQDAAIHQAMAKTCIQAGRLDDARQQLHQSLEIDPNVTDNYALLGTVNLKLGRLDEALNCLEKAIQQQPGDANAYYWWGAALRQKGDVERATAALEKSVALAPKSPDAHVALADLLVADRPRQALHHYQLAFHERPQSAAIANSIAWLMATSPDDELRNGQEAARLAQQACQSKSQSAAYLDTLAAAYAEIGDFPQAIRTAESALKHARQDQKPQLERQIEQRIKLYRSGQPFRDRQRHE